MFIGGDVFDPFAKVWPHLKVKKDYIWTDNWIYLLHRKWSFIFTLIELLVILSYVAILDHPMHCLGPTKDVRENYIKHFCWVWGTYIVPEYLTAKIGKEVPHPGIGPENINTTRMYHSHYVFYPLVLFFQACTFRFAKHLWSYLEGGRLKSLLSELSSPIVTQEKMNENIRRVTDYMTSYPATFLTKYSYSYAACEAFNLANLAVQFIMIDSILKHEFLTYGTDVLRYLNQNPPGYPSPFDRLFPKVTKCEIKKYGHSGSPQPMEAICIMPLHNFAEKIFLFTWFWFISLATITLLGLLYRLIMLCVPTARYYVLRIKTNGSTCDPKNLRYIVNHSSYGTWFVVSMLQKNMSPWVFANFITQLHDKIKEVKNKNL